MKQVESYVFRKLGVVLALGLVLAGCGGRSALIGRWVPEPGQRVPSSFIEDRLELSNDGTGIGDNYSLRWMTEGYGRLTCRLDIGQAFSYKYKVSGSSLVLTNDDGESVRYKKE
jgi:hypothetical protein